MIDPTQIEKILEVAVNAPSGDNSQPWRFAVNGNILDIYSLPEKDNPRFNFRERGTFIAHGALLENIVIAAREEGYEPEVIQFPDPSIKNHTYRVVFTKTIPRTQPLFSVIRSRQTNRKYYKKTSLLPEHKQALLNATDKGSLILIEDEEKKQIIGEAVGANEIVMLEDKQIHDLFYADVRWTTKSEKKLKHGLYLKTMELPLPKLVFFKLLQWWPAARVLNKLGMARFIAKDNGKLYGSASAIGIMPVPDRDEAFLEAGRIMQKVWLTGTYHGLSMHPVTGIIYLAQRVNAGEATDFLPEHVTIIKQAYSEIERIVGVHGPYAMLFRIGYSKPPAGVQSRQKPEIKYT